MCRTVGDNRTDIGLGFDHLFSTTTPGGPKSRGQSLGAAADYPPRHLVIISESFSSWGLMASPMYYGGHPFPTLFSIPTISEHMDPATLVTCFFTDQLSRVF